MTTKVSEPESLPHVALTWEWPWEPEPSIPVEAHGICAFDDWIAKLHRLAGCANASAWKGFPADTLLHTGIGAERQADDTWDAKARFLYRPAGWSVDENMLFERLLGGGIRRVPLEVYKLADFAPLDSLELDDWTPGERGAEINGCGRCGEYRLCIWALDPFIAMTCPGIVIPWDYWCERCWRVRKAEI